MRGGYLCFSEGRRWLDPAGRCVMVCLKGSISLAGLQTHIAVRVQGLSMKTGSFLGKAVTLPTQLPFKWQRKADQAELVDLSWLAAGCPAVRQRVSGNKDTSRGGPSPRVAGAVAVMRCGSASPCSALEPLQG